MADQPLNYRHPGCGFNVIFIVGLVKLCIYLYKLYSDGKDIDEFFYEEDYINFTVSVVTLAAPSIVCCLSSFLSSILKGDTTCSSLVMGALLIPRQIKKYFELLLFSANGVCTYRSPGAEDKQMLSYYKQQAFVLEFFEDFYAGFLQLLYQFCVIAHNINAGVWDENQMDTFEYHKIISSALTILSLVHSFQLRDDGPCTKVLAFIGWTSHIICKIWCLALSFCVSPIWLLFIVLSHSVAATVVALKIICKVHASNAAKGIVSQASKRKISLVIYTFFQFGVTSLIYWPMMFEFRRSEHVRRYLIASAAQNIVCLLVWCLHSGVAVFYTQESQILCLGVLALIILSSLFLSMYVCFKPALTAEVTAIEINRRRANDYGIFYDFVNTAGAVPDLSNHERRLAMMERRRRDLLF